MFDRIVPGIASLFMLALLVTKDGTLNPGGQPLPFGCDRYSALDGDRESGSVSSLVESALPITTDASQSLLHAVHTLYLDETIASKAVDAGFDAIVQVFPWRDLNPVVGVYEWSAADHMVRTAGRHHLDLVVRLDMPPQWAKQVDARDGLPFNLTAYAEYVGAVATRYRGRVLGYIIWNEPNLAAEWSRSGGDLEHHWSSFDGWVAEPADYVGVLGLAYKRVKQADPQALVVTAGLAPTNENSPRAIDDRVFLDRMFAAGARDCFDVVGVHAYGYGRDPNVHRSTQDGLNLARLQDLYDIMLAHEIDRPIWITELGYTIGAGQHPHVTESQQADYLIGAQRRINQEWPWIQLLTVWNLSYGLDESDEAGGFSLVDPDFTPRPAYLRLRRLLRE